MVDRGTVFIVLGAASAAAVSLLVAPYAPIDVALLSFCAMIVAAYCLRRAELPAWLKVKKPEVRSRVYRYAEIAKEGKRDPASNWIVNDDLSIFSATELRSLPREELAELEAQLRAAE